MISNLDLKTATLRRRLLQIIDTCAGAVLWFGMQICRHWVLSKFVKAGKMVIVSKLRTSSEILTVGVYRN